MGQGRTAEIKQKKVMSEKSKENGGGMEKEIIKEDKPKVGKKLDGKPVGTYTKAQLMNLSESPVSRKKHACLADEFCDDNGVWDPERWHASFSTKSSRGSSPIGFDAKEMKKKTLDPKERLKEEQRDGIVLSPQRRSFIHGCQVNTPSNDNGPNQPSSPYDNRDGHDRPPVRRIGSGRIIPNRTTPNSTDYQDKGRGRDSRDSRDYRYEPRNRYDRDRKHYRNHRDDEEPEWFTGGPTSQTDTIELRGFQEASSNTDEKKRKPEKDKPKKVANGTDKVRKSPGPVAAEEPKEEKKKAETAGGSKEFDINQFFNLTDGIGNIPVPSQEDTVGSGSRFSRWFAKAQSPVPDQQLGFLSELQGRQSPNLSASLFMPIKPDRDSAPQATSDILAMLQRGNTGAQRSNNSVQRFIEQHHGASRNRSPTPPPPGKVTCVSDLESQVKSLAEIEGDLYGMYHHQQNHQQNHHQLHFGDQPSHQMMAEQTAFNSFLANMQVKRGSGHRSHLMNEEKRSPSPIDLVLGMGAKRQSPLPWKDQGMPSMQQQQHHHMQQNHMSPHISASLQQLLQTTQASQSMINQHPGFAGNRMTHNTLQPPRPATRTPSPANADALSVAAMLKQMHNQPTQEHMRVMAPGLATEQQIAAAAIMKQTSLSADVAALAILQQQQQQQKEMLQHVSVSPAPCARALSPQEHVLQQVLYQQAAAAAAVGRGPSPANIGGTSPLQATTPVKPVQMQGSQMNMLTPGSMQPSLNMNRIPSPQELAAHTQNILHNAVIKRQLEVQKEKFLAREAARKTPTTPGLQDRPPPAARPPVTPAFTPTSVIRKMYETKAEAKIEDHDIVNDGNRIKQDLFKKLDSVSDVLDRPHQGHGISRPNPTDMRVSDGLDRQQGAGISRPNPNDMRVSDDRGYPGSGISRPNPNGMQGSFDMAFGSPSRKQHQEPQYHHQNQQNYHSPMNNLDVSANQRPSMQNSPGHQHLSAIHDGVHQHPSAIHDGINYKKIIEIQRQQQQKAAMAAAAGQSQQKAAMTGGQTQQASPSGQAMSSGMPRPMHHGFPIQMMQRAPVMRGIPHGMQVPNSYQQQMQRGGVGGMSPMMMNTRAAFPGSAVVQAGLVQNQTTPLGARREFNLGGNQPVNFGTENPTRASPVNLAKWFGNDLLQHPMPQMPQHNALGQRVISVEELERQQQAVG